MIIKVNDKEYNVQVVKEEKELEQGLKGVKELPEDGGMCGIQWGEERVL